MNKTINFFNRNFKEMLRDPLIYVFCLGFPLVMFALFLIVNKYTGGNTPMFELYALLPAIITFSYTFVMLTMALLVSKDRQTFFLKRLYSSTMKASDFILGYAIAGICIGFAQTLVCFGSGIVFSLVYQLEFISLGQSLLLIVSQLPILLTNVFLGILFGTLFNDKSAPGICSVFISASGILGGCWMPVETMGDFETFCRCLPFYPSVYIGKVITQATNAFGKIYQFDSVAKLGLIPLVLCTAISIVLSFVVFKNKMISDN